MNPRTLIALAVSAALLGGYVLLVERDQYSSDELRMQKRRVVPELRRDKVTAMAILRQGRTVTLRREGDEAWTVGAFRADPALADRILSGVEFLEYARTLPADSDLTRLGLDRPAARLTLTGSGVSEIQLRLGRLDTSGQGVYLAHGSRLFVVSASFRALLEKDPEQLRDAELVPLSQAEIRAVRFHNRELILTRDPAGKGWRAGPSATGGIRANARRVGKLLVALRSLRAARFLSGATRPDGQPWLEIQGKPGAATVYLSKPGPCAGRPTERRLAVTEQPKSGDTVSSACCVAAADLAPLLATPVGLMDLSLTNQTAATLARVTITRGARSLTLTRDGGRWMHGKVEVDTDLVRAWVADLAALEGDLRSPGHGEPQAAGKVELLSEEKEREIIRFGESVEGRAPALRHVDGARLWLPASVLKLLHTDAARFKKSPTPQTP